MKRHLPPSPKRFALQEKRSCSQLSLVLLCCVQVIGVSCANGNGANATTAPDADPCPVGCACVDVVEYLTSRDVDADFARLLNRTCASDVDDYVVALCDGASTRQHSNASTSSTTRVSAIVVDATIADRLTAIVDRRDDRRWRDVIAIAVSDAGVSDVAPAAFLPFGALLYLTLDRNAISGLRWAGRALRASPLETLDLSHNELEEVEEDAFRELSSLTSLRLNHNKIEFIGMYSFRGLTSLQHLDLTSNRLSSTGIGHGALFGLPRLESLLLGENRALMQLPNFDFIGLKSARLQLLDLHGLPFVARIDARQFTPLGSLRVLNLSHSAIKQLQAGWLDGVARGALEQLDLSFNMLTTIERDTFAEASGEEPTPLSRLKWLSLSNNRYLHALDDNAFSCFPSLLFLFLQDCNISRLKLAAKPVQGEANALKDTLPRLAALWISNNPFLCDCDMRLLLHASSFQDVCAGRPGPGHELVETNSSPVVLDPNFYWYEGECRAVLGENRAPACCRDVLNGHLVPIFNASLTHLVCIPDQLVVLVAIVIGPLAFSGAIFVVFACGVISVFLKRLRRYSSGKNAYKLLSKKTSSANLSRESSPLINRGKHRSNNREIFHTDLNAVSRGRSQRHTNIVLDRLRTTEQTAENDKMRQPPPTIAVSDEKPSSSCTRRKLSNVEARPQCEEVVLYSSSAQRSNRLKSVASQPNPIAAPSDKYRGSASDFASSSSKSFPYIDERNESPVKPVVAKQQM